MKWTDANENILVDFGQEHRCLYDVANKSLSNRNEKQKAHNEIPEKLSITLPVSMYTNGIYGYLPQYCLRISFRSTLDFFVNG